MHTDFSGGACALTSMHTDFSGGACALALTSMHTEFQWRSLQQEKRLSEFIPPKRLSEYIHPKHEYIHPSHSEGEPVLWPVCILISVAKPVLWPVCILISVEEPVLWLRPVCILIPVAELAARETPVWEIWGGVFGFPGRMARCMSNVFTSVSVAALPPVGCRWYCTMRHHEAEQVRALDIPSSLSVWAKQPASCVEANTLHSPTTSFIFMSWQIMKSVPWPACKELIILAASVKTNS